MPESLDANGSNAGPSAGVSSEGQGSAIQPQRSQQEEESAMSFAADEVAGPNRGQHGRGGGQVRRVAGLVRSTASVVSTAQQHHPQTPKTHSVVSQSVPVLHVAATPGSVYGQQYGMVSGIGQLDNDPGSIDGVQQQQAHHQHQSVQGQPQHQPVQQHHAGHAPPAAVQLANGSNHGAGGCRIGVLAGPSTLATLPHMGMGQQPVLGPPQVLLPPLPLQLQNGKVAAPSGSMLGLVAGTGDDQRQSQARSGMEAVAVAVEHTSAHDAVWPGMHLVAQGSTAATLTMPETGGASAPPGSLLPAHAPEPGHSCVGNLPGHGHALPGQQMPAQHAPLSSPGQSLAGLAAAHPAAVPAAPAQVGSTAFANGGVEGHAAALPHAAPRPHAHGRNHHHHHHHHHHNGSQQPAVPGGATLSQLSGHHHNTNPGEHHAGAAGMDHVVVPEPAPAVSIVGERPAGHIAASGHRAAIAGQGRVGGSNTRAGHPRPTASDSCVTQQQGNSLPAAGLRSPGQQAARPSGVHGEADGDNDACDDNEGVLAGAGSGHNAEHAPCGAAAGLLQQQHSVSLHANHQPSVSQRATARGLSSAGDQGEAEAENVSPGSILRPARSTAMDGDDAPGSEGLRPQQLLGTGSPADGHAAPEHASRLRRSRSMEGDSASGSGNRSGRASLGGGGAEDSVMAMAAAMAAPEPAVAMIVGEGALTEGDPSVSDADAGEGRGAEPEDHGGQDVGDSKYARSPGRPPVPSMEHPQAMHQAGAALLGDIDMEGPAAPQEQGGQGGPLPAGSHPGHLGAAYHSALHPATSVHAMVITCEQPEPEVAWQQHSGGSHQAVEGGMQPRSVSPSPNQMQPEEAGASRQGSPLPRPNASMQPPAASRGLAASVGQAQAQASSIAMAIAGGPSTRSGTISGGAGGAPPSRSNTVELSWRADSQMAEVSSSSGDTAMSHGAEAGGAELSNERAYSVERASRSHIDANAAGAAGHGGMAEAGSDMDDEGAGPQHALNAGSPMAGSVAGGSTLLAGPGTPTAAEPGPPVPDLPGAALSTAGASLLQPSGAGVLWPRGATASNPHHVHDAGLAGGSRPPAHSHQDDTEQVGRKKHKPLNAANGDVCGDGTGSGPSGTVGDPGQHQDQEPVDGFMGEAGDAEEQYCQSGGTAAGQLQGGSGSAGRTAAQLGGQSSVAPHGPKSVAVPTSNALAQDGPLNSGSSINESQRTSKRKREEAQDNSG